MVRQRFSAYGFERPPLSRRTFHRLAAVLVCLMVAGIGLASSGLLDEAVVSAVSRVVGISTAMAALLAWTWSALYYARRWRKWMTGFAAFFLCGLLLWTAGQIFEERRDLIEILAASAYSVAILFSIVGVILHAFDRPETRSLLRPRRNLVTPVLDLLIMVLSMALFVLVALTRPLQRSGPAPVLAAVTVQPLAYLLLVAVIIVLARFRTGARDLATAFLAIGALTNVISSTAFARTVDVAMITVPAWMESWFDVSPAFFLLAALAPSQDMAPDGRLRPTRQEIALLSIPYVPLIVSVILASIRSVTPGMTMPIQEAIVFMALLLLVVGRQLDTLAENLRLRRRAEHEALHDPLTGLANRTLFLRELELALRHHTRPLVLAFCDMDDFKEINDSYGHVVGDEVLLRTAQRLQRYISDNDMVARLGGDEFAVLLRDPSEALDSIEQRLLETLQQPHPMRGKERMVSASVGVTSLPAGFDVVDTDELLHSADTAMYTAKNRGKNTLAYLPEPRQRFTS